MWEEYEDKHVVGRVQEHVVLCAIEAVTVS